MEVLYLPPPTRMGLLVASKYARAGYAIRRAIWHGGVTLQNPTPSEGEIAAAHVLAWVTYSTGLYTYAEPVTPLSRVAQNLDALLADYEAADWTTLDPAASNDDVLNPNYVPVTTGGGGTGGSGSTVSGGFTLVSRDAGSSGGASLGGGAGSGGGGAGSGRKEHDCGAGMHWNGVACVPNNGAGNQPVLSLAADRVGDPDCTTDDPVTNHFGATAAVGDWVGAKAGDLWFITFKWFTNFGVVTGARGSKAVGDPLDDTLDITAHPGQRFKVFATAWLAGGSGITVSAQAWVDMQELCPPPPPPPTDHTVTFDGNASDGGSMSPQTASVPTALTANAFTRTGWVFFNWNTSSDSGGTFYGDGEEYPFDADVTLYATWVPA